MANLETIRLSKNNSTQWASLNPILADKEIGVEKDTKLFKVGNGVTTWNNLAYVASGSVNALFVFLSEDADNLLALSSDGGIFLSKKTFDGLASYTAGKEQGPTAPTPVQEYQATILRVGQDVFQLMSQLASLTTRVGLVEGKPVGAQINDAENKSTETWSAHKIVDYVLQQNLALKADITNNANGAYDALTRLADLLLDNNSLAAVITTELGNTVRFNESQTLTEQQKTQARQNIAAVSSDDIGDTSDLLDHYVQSLNSTIGSAFSESEI